MGRKYRFSLKKICPNLTNENSPKASVATITRVRKTCKGEESRVHNELKLKRKKCNHP